MTLSSMRMAGILLLVLLLVLVLVLAERTRNAEQGDRTRRTRYPSSSFTI
jgi:hypothetical protein